MTQSELMVLLVNSEGRVIGANRPAQAWVDSAGSQLCHRVVGAKDAIGRGICHEGCAPRLATEPSRSHVSQQAIIRGDTAQLRCERIGKEIVVFAERGSEEPLHAAQQLTPREREVMQLVVRGMTTKEISNALGINSSTVRTHVEHVRERLGARSRAEAIAKAMKTGQL